ncbi:MAG: hypothetical protein QM579_00305 [Desulfovibrio sp.]|uniref:hypothetical protein n=1 Tax=Desulfovibrio sp. TaxID=885 RepID=UPI0039E28354
MGLMYIPVAASGFPFSFADLFLKHGYDVCIETGTYLGQTTGKLSKIFRLVYTIEISEELYLAARKNLVFSKNVVKLFGSSCSFLPEILQNEKTSNVIFYLDAHYSGENTGETRPLLEEIEIINNHANDDAIIIIDDARIINMKYCNERYCDLPTFINLLHNKNRYISVINDQYIAVPQKFKEILDHYSTIYSTEENKTYRERARG